MAHLLVNRSEPVMNPNTKKYDEFDVEGENILNEIRALFSLREYWDREMVEKMLASLAKSK